MRTAPLLARLAAWSLLLNFAWEMLQAPYFVGMLRMPWRAATWLCTRATLGDTVIIVAAYGSVALAVRDGGWLLNASPRRLSAYALTAALLALALEWYSIRAGRWSYVAGMPVDPLLRLGLSPVLQWIFLPLLAAWIVRRSARPRGTGSTA